MSQKSYSEKIPAPAAPNGKKRHKSGSGGMRPPGPARGRFTPPSEFRPAIAKVEKGHFNTPPIRVEDRRPLIEKKPVTPATMKLLAEYWKRDSFERAIKNGASVEIAGEMCLGVKKVQAYKVWAELEQAQGAWFWFAAKAERGFRDGTIRPGRATEKNPESDFFFAVLSFRDPNQWVTRTYLEARSRVDMQAVHKDKHPLAIECLDFLVYSGNLWRNKGDD